MSVTDTTPSRQERAESRRLRSETELAKRRREAQSPVDRMRVEWDAVLKRIKAQPTEAARDAMRERVVQALRHLR